MKDNHDLLLEFRKKNEKELEGYRFSGLVNAAFYNACSIKDKQLEAQARTIVQWSIELNDKDKDIAQLKEELKREREGNDMVANDDAGWMKCFKLSSSIISQRKIKDSDL